MAILSCTAFLRVGERFARLSFLIHPVRISVLILFLQCELEFLFVGVHFVELNQTVIQKYILNKSEANTMRPSNHAIKHRQHCFVPLFVGCLSSTVLLYNTLSALSRAELKEKKESGMVRELQGCP